MYEPLDIKAEASEIATIHGPALFEVFIVHNRHGIVWASEVAYRTRQRAADLAERINSALFADRCVHGSPTLYIEAFGDLERDPTDITSYCSDMCRREAS